MGLRCFEAPQTLNQRLRIQTMVLRVSQASSWRCCPPLTLARTPARQVPFSPASPSFETPECSLLGAQNPLLPSESTVIDLQRVRSFRPRSQTSPSLPACLPPCLPASLPACLPPCLPACLPACLPTCLQASEWLESPAQLPWHRWTPRRGCTGVDSGRKMEPHWPAVLCHIMSCHVMSSGFVLWGP